MMKPAANGGPSSPTRRRTLAFGVLGALAIVLPVVTAFSANPSSLPRAVYRARLTWMGAEFVGGVPTTITTQETLYDCGPATLANLLRHLSKPVPPLDTLGALAGTTSFGTTFSGLVTAAERLGTSLTPVIYDRRLFSEQSVLPLIAWVNSGHFVLMTAVSPDSVATVIDPQVGAYRIPLRSFWLYWSGHALVPTSPHPSAPSRPSHPFHPFHRGA